MTTYIQKKAKVHGIQFTGDNRRKVIDVLKIDKEYCQSWINEDTKENYLLIDAPGCNLGIIKTKHWILIGMEPVSYVVCSPDRFQDEYEAIG